MTQPPGSPGPAGPYGPAGPPGPNGPYAPQASPPQFFQSPPAYPPAPNPYAPAPGPSTRTPTPPKHRGPVLIALAIVLGLALILAAAYVIGRVTAPAVPQPTPTPEPATSLTPTPTPSKARAGFTLDGTILSGATFTARIPGGWVLAESNGVGNDGEIIKDRSLILYWAPEPGTAEGRCTEVIESYHSKVGGTVETITGNWGRRPTVTKHLIAAGTDGRQVSMLTWCVDRPGNLAAVLMSATDTDHTRVAADAVSLLDSWSWT